MTGRHRGGRRLARPPARSQTRIVATDGYRVSGLSFPLIAAVFALGWGVPWAFGVHWPLDFGRFTALPLLLVGLALDYERWRRRHRSAPHLATLVRHEYSNAVDKYRANREE